MKSFQTVFFILLFSSYFDSSFSSGIKNFIVTRWNYIFGQKSLVTLANDFKQIGIEKISEPLVDFVDKTCYVVKKFARQTSFNKTYVDTLNFLLVKNETVFKIPLKHIETLLTHPAFQPEWRTVLFISGWLTSFKKDSSTHDQVIKMHKAYQSRGGYNFMYFNCSEKLNHIYTTSALETHALGWAVGTGLAQLANSYSFIQNIHIIGHSLGAHIAGRAGQVFLNRTYKRLARITGLDPALPCFTNFSQLAGISSNDAKFVDVIHSNIGVFGQARPLGDVDFYANGKYSFQNECLTSICSHSLAVYRYIDSVWPGQENKFMAKKCESWNAMSRHGCRGIEIAMGFAVPLRATGVYSLINGLD